MPQVTSFIIADRATTPVNHTFTPAGAANGVTTNVERGATNLESKKVTLSNREVRRASGSKFKARSTIYVPIVQTQTINGISTPVVVRVGRLSIDVEVDATATDQEKKDLLAFGYGTLSSTHPFVIGIVANEPFWQ